MFMDDLGYCILSVLSPPNKQAGWNKQADWADFSFHCTDSMMKLQFSLTHIFTVQTSFPEKLRL